MIRVCCYCGKELGKVVPLSDTRIIATSCKKCRKLIVKNLMKGKRNPFLTIRNIWLRIKRIDPILILCGSFFFIFAIVLLVIK